MYPTAEMDLVIATGYCVAALYVLWAVYLAVMALRRAREAKLLTPAALALALPLLLVALVIDVAINLLMATVVLFDRPREWTLSARLTRLGRQPQGWRGAFARWVCRHLLDAFDPSGRHCDC